jgi:hypothetical protein
LPMDPERTMDRRRAIELLDAVGLGGRSGHRPAEMIRNIDGKARRCCEFVQPGISGHPQVDDDCDK